jgi:uncharacterized protein YndB with AHSA1/START domain
VTVTDTMTMRARVAAPRDTVWRALSDPAELQVWFAEHARADLPRQFEFWGRYTPEGDAPHQTLLLCDERVLRFSWLLGGENTTVEIHVEPDGADATIVAVSQTHFDFQQALTEESMLGVIQTFWALSLGNLVDHLEGRGVAQRCDFTTSDLRAEIEINAPRERIYAALTDSDQASAWFGFPIGIEPWVGGRFAMGGLETDGPPTKIVDLEPGRKMSVDWGPYGNGIATWELADSGGKTRLTFVQSGFTTPRAPYAAWMGTLAGLLSLRRYVEQADWRSIYLAPA